MDLVTSLPKTKTGYDSIIVFVDRLSKMIHVEPTTSTVDAPGVAKIMFKTILRHHGLPVTIVSDRDTRFTSQFWTSLHKLCGTRLAMSTAYHPQTDGQTERANRTIIEMLRGYATSRRTDWDEHLIACEFAYNDSVNPSTGYTPFYLNHGRHPHSPSCTFPFLYIPLPSV
jgi:transposase InsO family protein